MGAQDSCCTTRQVVYCGSRDYVRKGRGLSVEGISFSNEEKKKVWEGPYTVHAYEVGTHISAPLTIVCNYLQDAAWHHAQNLQLGYKALLREKKNWVLARLSIEMKRYPLWGEQITVRTWPKGTQRLFALRDFEIIDDSGQRIGAAASAWVIVDTQSKRPQKPDPYFESMPLVPDRHALNSFPQKLPPVEKANRRAVFRVRYTDLDMHNHVNNAKYIEWVLNGYSAEEHERGTISAIQINFLAEAVYGDDVLMTMERRDREGYIFVHSAQNTTRGNEIFRARVQWTRTVGNEEKRP
jgi:medium-chain acyl-[acyl-carrier-protein] hydrolase